MRRFKISTTGIIMISFLLAILFGAILLTLPISSSDGEWTGFVDALFTSTTATCVTGLVVAPTFAAWSSFGHVVILILIQIGGLGIITVVAGLSLLLNRKMGLSDSILIKDAFNLNSLSGMRSFVKKVIFGTFIVEAVGTLLYMTVFVPEFGAVGIWYSVFNSVSAFCNAGIDIIGSDSMAPYVDNPIITFTTCSLIAISGIGYIVWFDVIRVIRERRVKKGRLFSRLTLHSKIAITATLVLIFGGAALIFVFEYNNPETMGGLSLFGKIQASIFQSVTTRTAGFFSVSQPGLTNASAFVSILLMFIGGSPVGTAGGIKTVTFVVLIVSAAATITGKNDVTVMRRRLTADAVKKAVGVTMMSCCIIFISTLLLYIDPVTAGRDLLDLLYEAVSATSTVGLSMDLSPLLSDFGKLVITAAMYLGRVGPISLAIAFSMKKQAQNAVRDPVEEISVG